MHKGFESSHMEGSYSAKAGLVFAARRSSKTSSANFPFKKTLLFLIKIIQIYSNTKNLPSEV
jgi:hypothetical protein